MQDLVSPVVVRTTHQLLEAGPRSNLKENHLVAWGMCVYGRQGYQTQPTERPKENTPVSKEQPRALTSLAGPAFVFVVHPSEALPPSRKKQLKKTQKAYKLWWRASRTQALEAKLTYHRCTRRSCPHPQRQWFPHYLKLWIPVRLPQQAFSRCGPNHHSKAVHPIGKSLISELTEVSAPWHQPR